MSVYGMIDQTIIGSFDNRVEANCPNCSEKRIMKHLGNDVLKCAICGGIYNIQKCISGIFDKLKHLEVMEPLERKCKNCNFWINGCCHGIDQRDEGFGWNQNPAILFNVYVYADDDSGLNVKLKTGPEFGCVRFKEK